MLSPPTRTHPRRNREEGHPPRLRRDHGHLYLWQHVHHAQHREERRHPRRRLLAVPPVLHGQAEDPRHRRPRRPLRGPLRQEGRRSSFPVRAGPPLTGGPARRVSTARSHHRTTRPSETTVLDSAQALVDEHAALERQMGDPAVASDPERSRELGKRYAALGPTVAAHHAWVSARDDLGAARELAAEDPAFAPGDPGARGHPGRRRGPAAPAAHPARPRRRPRRHPRGQGGGGRRGVGAVRRRPAADVPAARRAPGLAHRGARLHRERPRRLQGRARLGEGARHRRSPARRRGPG